MREHSKHCNNSMRTVLRRAGHAAKRTALYSLRPACASSNTSCAHVGTRGANDMRAWLKACTTLLDALSALLPPCARTS
jgi:hypothetical protein